MSVQELTSRFLRACEFKQAHDPALAATSLTKWIRACGWNGKLTVRDATNWKTAARAARAAFAALAALDALDARAASAASAARAASAAFAARAALDALDALDARDTISYWSWDPSWHSVRVIGAQSLGDEKPRDVWMPMLEALEAGVWLFWVLPTEIVYVPLPKIVHRNGRTHCENGPALTSLDLKLWLIEGIELDEQIVMRPATQTVEQIDKEENQDVRSIRIERFGWPRYLKESGAECRDERTNEIEGTREALYETSAGEQRLVVTCPTGRLFALGVPKNVSSCEAAQHWLAGGKNFNVLART